jgi:hypothetical protein
MPPGPPIHPTADFGGIGLVHVKEVGHHRPDYSLAAVVRRHGDNASKDLDRAAVPIFGDVVKGAETCVDVFRLVVELLFRFFRKVSNEVAGPFVASSLPTRSSGTVSWQSDRSGWGSRSRG